MPVKYNGNDRSGAPWAALAIVERLRKLAVSLSVVPVPAPVWAPASVIGRVGQAPFPPPKHTYALQGRSFHGR